jgi:purine-binding chemotaxis protein CheW
MTTRRKGKKQGSGPPEAGGTGAEEPAAPPGAPRGGEDPPGGTAEAWLHVPVDESAIRTYRDEDLLEGDWSREAEFPPPFAGPPAGTDVDAPPAGPLEFPLEESYDDAHSRSRASDEESLDLLCFQVESETFAVDIRGVREIIRARRPTELPGVAAHVSGIISLRGEIVPVLDLRRRLGFAATEDPGTDARIVVVTVNGKPAGFLVDSVSQKVRLPLSSMTPPPAVLGNGDSAYVIGVCRREGRLISVLAPDRVLGFGEIGGEAAGEEKRTGAVA